MNIKYKKAFTLLELVITLSILSIFLTFNIVNYKNYNSIINNVDNEVFYTSLINLINNSKVYCRKNKVNGTIYYKYNEKEFVFKANKKIIDKIKIPNKFKLTYMNSKHQCININNKGMSSDACTIRYKDRKGKTHRITMCVGTSYVEYKN
ncbi:hypothetical protein CLOACE_01810 [Clostridium acetireducens DSM 10703]|uniref:Prepilin-type N-terminal cleavage/methylation domain-containing protein n=1 Tax=Clostridium acetireducens DSM 10703 TaxID=1121290 RepID=A0A1E8F1Q0_9CLOT|nr:type II secretion system protein [Clostridium acetireducens]OFI07577.1 hypothetical protein CLOACE_01810 [Clostridium acetireducens DSM 10703]